MKIENYPHQNTYGKMLIFKQFTDWFKQVVFATKNKFGSYYTYTLDYGELILVNYTFKLVSSLL